MLTVPNAVHTLVPGRELPPLPGLLTNYTPSGRDALLHLPSPHPHLENLQLQEAHIFPQADFKYSSPCSLIAPQPSWKDAFLGSLPISLPRRTARIWPPSLCTLGPLRDAQ